MARSRSNLLYYYNTLSNDIKRLHEHLISPPMLNYIFKNKDALKYNADIIPFRYNTWNENPMIFCIDQYNNQQYFPVILICNNLGSIYEFTSDNLPYGITAPLIDTLQRIINVKPLTKERY